VDQARQDEPNRRGHRRESLLGSLQQMLALREVDVGDRNRRPGYSSIPSLRARTFATIERQKRFLLLEHEIKGSVTSDSGDRILARYRGPGFRSCDNLPWPSRRAWGSAPRRNPPNRPGCGADFCESAPCESALCELALSVTRVPFLSDWISLSRSESTAVVLYSRYANPATIGRSRVRRR